MLLGTYTFPKEVSIDGGHDFPFRFVKRLVMGEYGIALRLVDKWFRQVKLDEEGFGSIAWNEQSAFFCASADHDGDLGGRTPLTSWVGDAGKVVYNGHEADTNLVHCGYE